MIFMPRSTVPRFDFAQRYDRTAKTVGILQKVEEDTKRVHGLPLITTRSARYLSETSARYEKLGKLYAGEDAKCYGSVTRTDRARIAFVRKFAPGAAKKLAESMKGNAELIKREANVQADAAVAFAISRGRDPGILPQYRYSNGGSGEAFGNSRVFQV